ncbi:hypothetical protein H9L39_08244 [Fusarium oxysporum f. sp. albedinis]|nr:hypothetical protein H9L39_08244 [Fusarium oxysporum f. sp. albedinis]
MIQLQYFMRLSLEITSAAQPLAFRFLHQLSTVEAPATDGAHQPNLSLKSELRQTCFETNTPNASNG